ncbi:hypothetical protein UlMin_007859 [Ulmus minor]
MTLEFLLLEILHLLLQTKSSHLTLGFQHRRSENSTFKFSPTRNFTKEEDKDCLDVLIKCHACSTMGVLDGTYVRVRVPVTEMLKYRNWKGDIATNVLGVCSQDMQFIYVLPGWEGLAANDAGYTNCNEFLALFRGQRYHLSEWIVGQQPTSPEELFNLRHSSARNVIERCFGVLKNRWAILRSPSFYPIKTQNHIIMACCLLHNFIRREMPDDIPDMSLDDENIDEGSEHSNENIIAVEPSNG